MDCYNSDPNWDQDWSDWDKYEPAGATQTRTKIRTLFPAIGAGLCNIDITSQDSIFKMESRVITESKQTPTTPAVVVWVDTTFDCESETKI